MHVYDKIDDIGDVFAEFGWQRENPLLDVYRDCKNTILAFFGRECIYALTLVSRDYVDCPKKPSVPLHSTSFRKRALQDSAFLNTSINEEKKMYKMGFRFNSRRNIATSTKLIVKKTKEISTSNLRCTCKKNKCLKVIILAKFTNLIHEFDCNMKSSSCTACVSAGESFVLLDASATIVVTWRLRNY